MKKRIIAVIVILLCSLFCARDSFGLFSNLGVTFAGHNLYDLYSALSRENRRKGWAHAYRDCVYFAPEHICFIGEIVESNFSRHFHNSIYDSNYESEYSANNYDDIYGYTLIDANNVGIHICVHTNPDPDVTNTRFANGLHEMSRVEDLRIEPVDPLTGKHYERIRNLDRWFLYDNIKIGYSDGVFRIAEWNYRNYTIVIWLTETGDSLDVYPKGKDTYMNRLLDPETTHQAVQEMNDVIDWVFYTRPVVLRVASYAGCAVFLVGVVLLIVLRGRKKATAAAEATEEIKE